MNVVQRLAHQHMLDNIDLHVYSNAASSYWLIDYLSTTQSFGETSNPLCYEIIRI